MSAIVLVKLDADPDAPPSEHGLTTAKQIATHSAPMSDQRTHTIATIRQLIRSLQQALETEQRIASSSNLRFAQRARAEIPLIQARIAEAEARVRDLDGLRPA